VKSGEYLTALVVDVFGITTFVGLGASFLGTCFTIGLIAGFTSWGVGAATAGFLTGGAGAAFAGAGVAIFLAGTCFLAATGGITGFLTGATAFLGSGFLATGLGAGFFGATFLAAGFTAFLGAAVFLAAGLAAGRAVLEGFADFTALAPEERAGFGVCFFVAITMLPLFYDGDLQVVIINLYFSTTIYD
jgi:hypothetical protein